MPTEVEEHGLIKISLEMDDSIFHLGDADALPHGSWQAHVFELALQGADLPVEFLTTLDFELLA